MLSQELNWLVIEFLNQQLFKIMIEHLIQSLSGIFSEGISVIEKGRLDGYLIRVLGTKPNLILDLRNLRLEKSIRIVIPAKAGIKYLFFLLFPVFTGMTKSHFITINFSFTISFPTSTK